MSSFSTNRHHEHPHHYQKVANLDSDNWKQQQPHSIRLQQHRRHQPHPPYSLASTCVSKVAWATTKQARHRHQQNQRSALVTWIILPSTFSAISRRGNHRLDHPEMFW
eukprot:CAMPEP_0194066570 /NCGR_PEP_ID=MMETSP0009_2-20130614/86094_1 /TAXON_ID=210454 /ORGANISM="Grammatophora oceanica, Strain CCMP 410" /LENGTH=107 /DNA_ID=CAMNT_0038719535 /DNA_START=19 /DNA_END=339 /DNA_ORIENTATION=+